ncbi:hypothetical protein DYQ86_26035 [Acidobacteria bacterium AB60]|nr:hypothetical protein DYQ86_26035 [Acidobacteria bacterium AB60]
MSKIESPQDFKHHARLHLPFHIFSFGILALNLIAVIIHLVRHPGWWNAWLLVLSIAVFVPFFLIRTYALKVQDRVIRLEERVRLKELAPADFRSQVDSLTADQCIGLRFASDEEVVALARQALEQNLTRKQIKERIQAWRPDHWRV